MFFVVFTVVSFISIVYYWFYYIGPRPNRIDKECISHSFLPKPISSFDKLHAIDHHYISLSQYLWAFGCIFFGNLYNQATGITSMLALFHLERWLGKEWSARLRTSSPPPEQLVAKLILETSLVLRLGRVASEVIERSNSEKACAIFTLPNFGYLNNKGTYVKTTGLRVKLNLTDKWMVSSYLGDTQLTAEDTFVHLVIFYQLVYHAYTHTIANWAVHLPNPYIRGIGSLTVAYNYFGGNYFPRFALLVASLGLVYPCHDLYTYLDDQRQRFITNHATIYEFKPYSRYVSFLLDVRGPFMRYFADYKDNDFKEMDPEALFVGTIAHNLDHTLLEWVIADPMWISSSNPELDGAKLLSRIILTSFNRELPLLPYNRKYKNASHPFFRRVYQAALSPDPQLADIIDTCICK